MPKCIILQGIPNSGKNYWIEKNKKDLEDYHILSCDDIRINMSHGKYIFDPKIEKDVWEEFYYWIEKYSSVGASMIINNTNLKQAYINQIMCRLTDNYEVEIKRFDVPLWKAHLRNIIRRVKTGKWIPWKVMNNMYKNYKKLEK